jgi:23S rRNA (adenine2503-C2)-methyltransferase
MTKQNILDLTNQELKGALLQFDNKPYRIGQLIDFIYKKKLDDFSRFSALPLGLRNKLAENFFLRSFVLKDKLVSRKDGTMRFNFSARDGQGITAVFLPGKGYNSVCVSTQIGCPVKCAVCASGNVKFTRNLTSGEILEQVLQVENITKKEISSILFMGMGEPTMNFDNVVLAVQALLDPEKFGISRRHVIVSTMGIVPAIEELSKLKLGIRLAISVHAPDDELRQKIVPLKFNFKLEDILKAAIKFSRENNSRLTLEYTLIKGFNDTLKLAEKFVKMIKKHADYGDKLQVNLIPCNENRRSDHTKPDPKEIREFMRVIALGGINVTLREPRGPDIQASCGQLGV